MPTRAWRRARWMAMLALAVVVTPPSRGAAQGVSQPALKAAFLLNFVKFAQWPGDVLPSGAPLVLCVLGDDDVATALDAVTKEHPVDSHALVVKRVSADGVRPCHLLYISGADAKESIALVRSLNSTPALTVSDISGFAQSGGIINFIVEDGRLRFVVNTDAADRARVRPSSRLLGLAKIVNDRSNVRGR
jgi:hypothetical protein